MQTPKNHNDQGEVPLEAKIHSSYTTGTSAHITASNEV